MEKIVKKIIGILFAVFMLAGIVMCDRPATQPSELGPIDSEKLDTPSNGREKSDPNGDDSSGANQSSKKIPSLY